MKALWTICLVPLLATPTFAATSDGKGCDLVNFSQEVLQKFPNAQRACRGVAEKNGGVYVHYIGEIESVATDKVTIRMLGPDGKPVSRATFIPAQDQRLHVEGKETKYTDLKKGQKVDFYIEHSKWGLYSAPDGKRMTIVSQETL